jgi:hypothetical protein
MKDFLHRFQQYPKASRFPLLSSHLAQLKSRLSWTGRRNVVHVIVLATGTSIKGI